MNNNMEYKGYLGSVEFSEEEAVDEYSSICEQQ